MKTSYETLAKLNKLALDAELNDDEKGVYAAKLKALDDQYQADRYQIEADMSATDASKKEKLIKAQQDMQKQKAALEKQQQAEQAPQEPVPAPFPALGGYGDMGASRTLPPEVLMQIKERRKRNKQMDIA